MKMTRLKNPPSARGLFALLAVALLATASLGGAWSQASAGALSQTVPTRTPPPAPTETGTPAPPTATPSPEPPQPTATVTAAPTNAPPDTPVPQPTAPEPTPLALPVTGASTGPALAAWLVAAGMSITLSLAWLGRRRVTP